MTPEAALGEALAALRRGEAGRAQVLVEGLLAANRGDFRVLHLAGELAMQAGRRDEAVALLQRALAQAPGMAEIHYSLARAQWREGHDAAARECAFRALALRPDFAPAAMQLAIIEATAGKAREARAQLVAAGAADIANFAARDLAVRMLAAEVEDGRAVFARWMQQPSAAPVLSFTVAVCSIDQAKLARAQAALRAVEPREAQWIVIRDARSLAEAYNRAIDRATGEAIVFMHDDVEVLSPGPFAALSRALAAAGVAGVAGTQRLAGPTVGWAGQEFARGALAHGSSAAGQFDYSVLNWTDGVTAGIGALDGCLIAARTSVARELRFDEETFDGFHFYDLDFALRAGRSGAGVAVTAEVLLAHASRGSTAGPWQAQAGRFLAKFPEIGTNAVRPNHFYATRFTRPERVRAMHAEMRGLASLLADEG